MPILTVPNPSLPNQNLGAGDALALSIEEFTGTVEGTLQRESKLAPMVAFRPVVGTSTLTNEGIGKSTLQKLVRGEAPDPTVNQAAQVHVTVDTTVIARGWVQQLEDLQKNYAFKNEMAVEHGKELGKFVDQAIAIQAYKAAMLTQSAFGALPGHEQGSRVTLINAADLFDPAVLYSAIGDLMASMEEKDVNPGSDGVALVLPPRAFYALSDADRIVDGAFTTANGSGTIATKVIKAWNIPVINSNNLPKTNITNHFLSNTRNGNAFDGDFTKLGAVAFSARSLLVGQTVGLQTKTWWDELTKGYYIDAWMAFSATPNRAEYSGAILLP